MVFNSIDFIVFLVIAFSGYLMLRRKLKWQNRWLLVMSYLFYGTFSWEFLLLLVFSSTADFFLALKIEREGQEIYRRYLLTASLIMNLTILGFFKYFNFFSNSYSEFASLLGLRVNDFTLNVILPMGISFYTIQEIGYMVDVYRRRMRACSNLVNYALFVSYFPHLVAGPVQRSNHLLPAIENPRKLSWSQFESGFFLIFLGLFYKIVIADNLSLVADRVFNETQGQSAESVLLGVYAFAFQIYCDFLGYSTMARGISRILGIELLVNFNVPYFSRRIDDFWKRWHISLSNWLRDYLYFEMGGNRNGKRARNIFLTMLIGGFWHGASWTMIIWGSLHGIYLIAWKYISEKNFLPPPPFDAQHICSAANLTCIPYGLFSVDIFS